MNKTTNNLQDIFLTNGFQLKGYVKGFDSFTIVLDNLGKQYIIYKHAISTIVPATPILFNTANTGFEENTQKE